MFINAYERYIIKTNVINLYPEGADKNIAIQEAEDSKYKLRNVISCYEQDRKDYINYLNAHRDKLEHCKTWTCNFPKGHDAVEKFYQSFYKE